MATGLPMVALRTRERPMNSKHAGWHMICDAHVASKQANLLNDKEAIHQVILDLVDGLGMKFAEPPQIVQVRLDEGALWSERDEGGLRCLTLLELGYLNVFTYPVRHRASIDLFSGRPVKKGVFDELLREKLHVTKRWIHEVPRLWSEGEFNPHATASKPSPVEIP